VERHDIRSLRVKYLRAIKAYREADDDDDNDDTSESTVSCDDNDDIQGDGSIVVTSEVK
jgi:hypothetical protein